MEKYFIHTPVGEIQISRVAQKIINIYNDFILNNNRHDLGFCFMYCLVISGFILKY